MGIRGVESYMRNSPNIAYRVKLEEMAQQYRKQKGKEPLIVVDGVCFMNRMYLQFDWLLGGQFKEYVRNVENFVKAFASINVKLVFIFSFHASFKEKWKEERIKYAKTLGEIVNEIDEGIPCSRLIQWNSHHSKPIPLAGLTLQVLQRIQNCTVHIYRRHRKMRVVRYAEEAGAAAILAQDSHYVFYQSDRPYLSVKYLDIREMTSECYDREEFARSLRIPTNALTILGALLETTKRSRTSLFYKLTEKKVSEVVPHILFRSVSSYIKRLITKHWRLDDVTSEIARTVFEDDDSGLKFLEEYQKFADFCPENDSIRSAECFVVCEEAWKRILKRAEDRYDQGEMHPDTYNVVVGRPFPIWLCLQGLENGAVHVDALYSRLRQRMYAILLHEYRSEGREKAVEEWCATVEGERIVRVVVDDKLPPSLHPGLLVLWDNANDEKTAEKKWALFSRAVSSTTSLTLRTLPSYLVIPAAVLHYLCHVVEDFTVEIWETHALIAQAVLLHTETLTSLSEIEIVMPNARIMQLATIFIQGCFYVQMLVDTLGYPIPKEVIHPDKYFDGKLFHSIYLDIKRGKKAQEILKTNEQMKYYSQVKKIVF